LDYNLLSYFTTSYYFWSAAEEGLRVRVRERRDSDPKRSDAPGFSYGKKEKFVLRLHEH